VLARLGGRLVPPMIYGTLRALIAFMRSIHELLWAVLFLAAMGMSPLSAVIAIAIPYTGTLAKVFSEMLDEAPRGAAEALRAAGASSAQVFLFGLLPRALPDICAYTFYRFECALRSSAVLGFFGYPTLGFYISASFENLYYAAGSDLQTEDPLDTVFTPTLPFRTDNVSLLDYVGEDDVLIAFVNWGLYGNRLFLECLGARQ